MSDQKQGKEPQSYGSGGEWLSGKTGQSVEESQSTSRRRDEGFYEGKADREETGGHPSQVRLGEKDHPAPDTSAVSVVGAGTKKVTDTPEGAATTSYFKERDYD